MVSNDLWCGGGAHCDCVESVSDVHDVAPLNGSDRDSGLRIENRIRSAPGLSGERGQVGAAHYSINFQKKKKKKFSKIFKNFIGNMTNAYAA
jgi:hypothetical protein